jgi:tRNA A-37 threonylcarbamoyl transferase component Bud32
VKKKLNCWDYFNCGRELSGDNACEFGVCPAARDQSFDGINSGKNGGRICWAVTGTFCDGKKQGSYIEKRSTCIECDFYKSVRNEEGTLNRRTKFLKYIPQADEKTFFDNLDYIHIKAGKRFITQGEPGDSAYIIQKGSCLVIVEKDGELHPVRHYGEGDIVGGVGILTGEPRIAHVEAETDLELWALTRDQFDNLSKKDPELLNFITELVNDRFDSQRPMAYRTIGKYVATDIIGRGAFSIVYKGKHSALDMPVAIKMMRHNMAMDSDFLSGFHNEAKLIARIDHKNIVKIYDITEHYRTVFIIMELVKGETLKNLIHRLKRIPHELTVRILIQICNGLEYAHQLGIIHRDINPRNIMLLSDDKVKILDFGLACPFGTEEIGLFGTVYYMAPEQIPGKPMDQRTDIYALGIMAYEMATGEKPYPDDEIKKVMEMHVNQDIPNPADIIPDIPEPLQKFIIKACNRNPGKRYQNIIDAREELFAFINDIQTIHREKSIEIPLFKTLFLTYHDKQQLELSRIIEEFNKKAQDLGVEIKVADLHDIYD